ncbi:MAG: EamA family transporter [Acidobacteria bacterium]|nr:EamA family transporter [Acidobacteriota bacterium]
MNLRVVVVWWLVCALWSSTFLFIKLGLGEIPPLTFAWVRLAIALTVLAPLAVASRATWRLGAWDVAHVCIAGVLLLGLNYGLVFWGSQFVPSGLVAILQSGTPVLALGFGWLLGSEAVTGRKLLAVALGVGGVATIFGAQATESNRMAVVGAASVLAGSVCVAFAYVWLKTHGQHLLRTSVTALQSLAGLIPLAALGLALEGVPQPGHWSITTWTALLYLGLLASVAAFWLNYWLLAHMDTSAMLMMGVAEVPIAVALGAIVFGERLPPGTLLGATFVLGGVLATLTGQSVTADRQHWRPRRG